MLAAYLIILGGLKGHFAQVLADAVGCIIPPACMQRLRFFTIGSVYESRLGTH